MFDCDETTLTGPDTAVIRFVQLERQHVLEVVLSKYWNCLEQAATVSPQAGLELLVRAVHRVGVDGGGDRVELFPGSQATVSSEVKTRGEAWLGSETELP